MRRVTSTELKQILQQHKLWIESSGEVGTRADLRGAQLQWANLRFVDLRGADLRFVDLRGAVLRDVLFSNTDLRGVKLDLGFRDCTSFWDSKFTSDALPWLILHPKWRTMKASVTIEERQQ